MIILVFNAGSSSLKYELFESEKAGTLKVIHKGHFDNHGKEIKDFEKVVRDAIKSLPRQDIDAIGHRVVHGGEKYTQPTLITPAVLRTIKKLSELAPLHNTPNLAGIEACKKIFGKIPQLAVFDTAFHQTMPEHAYLYGLPYSYYKKMGIRRYGFHGTSHQYVFEQARKKLGARATKRTVTCHLGNGCSITAVENGKVIDTSMGFTPLEGVPMGTRSGDIDPAIIFYLIERGATPHEVEALLNKKSGLLGVSEFSSDVRDLWAAYKGKMGAAKKTEAKRTLHWFAYRIAKQIGAYQAALKGLDCIVFTGGTGVGASYLRRWILEYFPKFPKKCVLVIPTDEERKIAEEVLLHLT